MDAKALATYSRMEFNKNVNLDDGRSIEAIRSEVFSYMTNANLDLEAEHQSRLLAGGMILEKEVTAEEYKAVIDGLLILKLVPALNTSVNPVLLDRQGAVIDLTDANVPAYDSNAATDAQTEGANEENLPTLTELLAGLDKAGLIEFAKEHSISFANSMNPDQLRAKIIRDLNKTGS
jgi:hypothetical protein